MRNGLIPNAHASVEDAGTATPAAWSSVRRRRLEGERVRLLRIIEEAARAGNHHSVLYHARHLDAFVREIEDLIPVDVDPAA